MAFKLGIAYNDYAHFDDLDLDARSQWVGRRQRQKSALNYLDN